MSSTTVADLQEHLQWAIEVAHSTIPPYLCTYFSIQDSSSAAANTILSVVLDHNITFDADSSLDRLNDPNATINFRTGRVDLEHVYGLGPEQGDPASYLSISPRGTPTLGQGNTFLATV